MKIILFDLPNNWANLLPLTFTRPISDIRCGIFTIKERWQKLFPEHNIIPLSVDYLNTNDIFDIDDEMLYLNSSLFPDKNIISLLKKLDLYKGIQSNGQLLAYKGFVKYQELTAHFPFGQLSFFIHPQNPHYQKALLQSENINFTKCLQYPFQIFQWNEEMINFDFENFISDLPQGLLSSSNTLIGSEKKLYISPTAKVEGSIINTNTGYVFIDDNAEIMEGSCIRGPLALCQSATLKMSSKIYGATTIGPHCKVGGEVNNSVFFAYSNKAHDGFIGNSVIGEWCNLGADTNNSNLKNNYSEVKIYNYLEDTMINTGLQFCGLIMGDHSKSGINTMFNTGTVVGVAANIFGADFPPKHIPSFSWGGAKGFQEYKIEKLFETAQEMYKRRQKELTDREKNILQNVLKLTTYHRNKYFL
ncbi:MAG: glucose-1-phosphate thymidylyltransferase [Bacteroidia bacterium]|nr:MAG: glucose-1-phosphate thymidylyltransferase [Bacteroidia bacterium]